MVNAQHRRSEGDEATLAQVVGRGYWRESDARVVLDALERSGLRLTEFARRHGVRPERLSRWRERLGGDATDGAGLVFLPVHVREERAAPAAALELVVGRYTVRVASEFDASALDRLIDVLERRGG
jgi:hypothetical protein